MLTPTHIHTPTSSPPQAFNLLFFILVNLGTYGAFTMQVSARGSRVVQDPEAWDRTMRQNRAFSVFVVALGWALSVALTGLLPSLFTLCILLSGVSLNRFILLLVVKVLPERHTTRTQSCCIDTRTHDPSLPPHQPTNQNSPSAPATSSNRTSAGSTAASATTWATPSSPRPPR